MKLSKDDFDELVKESVDSLPENFAQKMENIIIVTEDIPSLKLLNEMKISSPYGLLGLYRGIPYTKRGIWYRNVMPDKIIIFKIPIEIRCKNKDEVRESIKQVVMHEIGHYFGLLESDLRRIEKERNNKKDK